MLTLLWGRAGSGKTTHIVNEICSRAKNGESGLVWLVPEPFSHECERLLAKAGGPAVCLSAEVMTFGRMADRVLTPYGAGARGLLSEGGRLLTMRLAVDIVRESLSIFARAARSPAFLSALLKTADECKCYAISPDSLYAASENASGAAAGKLRELSLIFAAYDAVLQGGSIDPRDRMTALADALSGGAYARDKSLYVDSFVTFTPQERDVLRAFIANARDVTAAFTGEPESDDFVITRRSAEALSRGQSAVRTITLEGAPRWETPALAHLERHFFDIEPPVLKASDGVRAVCAASVPGECAFIAREVKWLAATGLRYREMVVAVQDMPRYAPHLERAFEREGIPVFMDSMDDVSAKPLCRFLKASADIVTRGWRCPDVQALLDTGLFRAPRALTDRLTGYLRRWKPEGKRWASDWGMHPGGYAERWTEEDFGQLRLFNRLRLLLYAPLSLLKNGGTAKGWTEALLRYIKQARLQQALSRRMKALRARGELKSAEECSQFWEILLDSMAMCSGILEDSPMGLDTYMELLLLVLSGAKVGSIPVALDRVSVGELGRLRRVSARVAFVPGCDAGHMPSVRAPESLLSAEERAALEALELELPPDGEARLLRESFNIYSAFALPSRCLYMSFTREPGGGELPADALRRACELLDVQIEPLSPEELPWKAPEDMRAPLSSRAVEALYGRDVRLSATRLECLLECGFAFFCRYGLRARPDIEPGFSPLDTGLFIHEILEKTGRRTQESGGARAVSPELVRAWADEYAQAYIARVLRGFDDHGLRFRRRFERLAASGADIAENVRAELAASLFEPLAFELGFGGRDAGLPALRLPVSPGGLGFRLEGKIDRADSWRAPDGELFVRVADYKTGARDFSLSGLYYGKGIQLPLYLFALSRHGAGLTGTNDAVPAGMLYIPASRPLLSAPGRLPPELEKSGLEKALRRDGLLLADEGALEAMGATADSPSPFLPAEWKKGVLSPKSTASRHQMKLLSGHIDRLVAGAARSLAEGGVEAAPLAEGAARSACAWCEYARCCYFGGDGDGSRDMTLKDSAFWETLEREDKNGGEV